MGGGTARPSNGPTLREYVEGLFRAHEKTHSDHADAHEDIHRFTQNAIDKTEELAKQHKADANEWRGAMVDRESRFATRSEVASLAELLAKLENAEIRRSEREALRLVSEAEEKHQAERRVNRSQWQTSIVVGFVVLAITLVFRLLTPSL